jgi:ribosomal protein S18 acetylase RimI-like enzyme
MAKSAISNAAILNLIVPPYRPDLPGLVFRGFLGEPDYANILAIITASKQVDGIERSDTLEKVANTYAHLHNCDPYQDMIFAEMDGTAVGYGRVWWDLNESGEWNGGQLAFLHPDWRRKGIGTTILRHNEARLRQIAGRLQAEGTIRADTPRFIDVETADAEQGKAALLEQEGYRPVRYEFHMLRPLTQPVEVTPLPEGLEVRPVLVGQVRAVWDASQEAFRDHWNWIPQPDVEFRRMVEGPEFEPGLWMVAWDGDQVAGSVLNFIDSVENAEYQRRRGYTEGISVRRPWRRRGLARALLTRSLKMFQEMGMQEAALGVDSQNLNGANLLYESVGFRLDWRQTIYRKSLENQV